MKSDRLCAFFGFDERFESVGFQTDHIVCPVVYRSLNAIMAYIKHLLPKYND